MADIKLVGRLVRDVVSFDNGNGTMTHLVTVARQHNFKSADGEYGADFIELKGFSRSQKAHDFYMDNLKKATLVEVEADFRSSRFEKNGETVYSIDAVIDNINPFLERRTLRPQTQETQTPVQETAEQTQMQQPVQQTAQQPVQTQQQPVNQQPVQQPVQGAPQGTLDDDLPF